MAIETKSFEVIHCDQCRKEIERCDMFPMEGVEVERGYVGQGTDMHNITSNVKVSLSIPYGPKDPVLCKDCAGSIMVDAMNRCGLSHLVK